MIAQNHCAELKIKRRERGNGTTFFFFFFLVFIESYSQCQSSHLFMSSQEEKDKQESGNLSSTKYILQNLQDFNYLDFCTTFKDNLNDKEDSIRLLKKGLDIIRMSASNKKSTRDLADQLLNDIDVSVN